MQHRVPASSIWLQLAALWPIRITLPANSRCCLARQRILFAYIMVDMLRYKKAIFMGTASITAGVAVLGYGSHTLFQQTRAVCPMSC